MGVLGERMKEEMVLRGFSEHTIRAYTGSMVDISRFVQKPPLRMDAEDVRSYFLHLIKERGASYSLVQQAASALKFFLRQHGREHLEKSIPRMKPPERVAAVMNAVEVEALMNALSDLRKRAIFVTIYCAGLRLGEACRLELADIDPERMQIKIRSGKGRKDRYTVLFRENLEILRSYILEFRPQKYLFYPKGRPLDQIRGRRLEEMFVQAKIKAGIRNKISVHTLRHTFATRLLENGVNIFAIQKLMGHSSILTTMKYLHIVEASLSDAQSPLNGCHLADGSMKEANQMIFRFDMEDPNWRAC